MYGGKQGIEDLINKREIYIKDPQKVAPYFMEFPKDVVSPGRMRRRIERPRVLLLDCPLEYKKGENQTNVELSREEDWCGFLWHFLFCEIRFKETRFKGRQNFIVLV